MSTVYHKGFSAMGTRFHMILPGMEDQAGELICKDVQKEVNRIEHSLTRFTTDSEISLINKIAGHRPVKVSHEVYDILKTCNKYFQLTEGGFDITLRPLLEYWKRNKKNSGTDEKTPQKIRKDLGMNRIHFNDSERTVFFENEHIEIDLGGYGKGYALDSVQKMLCEYGVKSAFLSFGESSIMTLGSHPAGDHWKVGLNHYLEPGKALYTFHVNDAAVSTSSNFFVDDNGKLHNHKHVMNPYTGRPSDGCVTVSVCTNSSVVAEILSTAFLVCREETIRKVKQLERPRNVIKVDYTTGTPEVMNI